MPRFSAVSRCAFHSLCLSTLPVRTVFFRVVPLLVLTLSSVVVQAQSDTATLSGIVTDERGAMVSGVNITVINIAQNFQRSTTTNDEGTFVVVSLTPGNYSVKAEHDGFSTAELKDVILNVNDQRLIKILLKVGNISQTVEIVDSSSFINQSPAVATIVDRQFVDNLPLNGRSFQFLINLSPGVVLTKSTGAEQGQFSVNGQRASANYFTVDGVSGNIGAIATIVPGQSAAGSLPGLSAFGGTNNLVSVDALQEFKIQTSTFAPEFGRTPGAQVSLVTRSGTNAFHGSLFDYVRNDVLDATDWFVNANPALRKPPLRQNNFGAVVGGPILLPQFGEGGPALYNGKDRLFFFFSYEGLRLRQPLVGISDVPSLTARQTAPAALQPLLNMFPKPNGVQRPNGLANFSASFSNPTTLNATSIRIDGVVNNKLILFGRYNHSPSDTIARGASATLNTLSHFDVKTQTLTFGATYLPSATVNNDLRVNFSRHKASTYFTVDEFGGAVIPPESILLPANRSTVESGGTVSISGALLGSFVFGKRPESVQRQFNIVNNLSFLRGNHQFKFGVDYRRLAPIFDVQDYLQTLVFTGVGTAASAPAGSFLSGRVAQVTISAFQSPHTVIFNNFSLYAQDTWKISTKLALTYGVRWDVNPPPHEANGNDPVTLTQIDNPATFAFAPRGTPLWKTTYDNFAPRFGLSYQLSNRQGRETMLRGGVGIFYDLGNGAAGNAFVGAYPFTAIRILTNVPFPVSASNSAAPIPGPLPTSFDMTYVFDPELKQPRVYQWNVSIDQSLGVNQTITSSYVAALGRRLLRQGVIRTSPTIPGNIFIGTNDATSDYHALQMQFRRRFSRGFQALASYTWAHSIDIVSADSLSSTPSSGFDPRLDRGPSDFDLRHALNGAFTYDIPTPKVGRISKILANWSADAIVTARSATPVNVTYTAITAFGQLTLRPDLVEGIPLYLDDPTVPGGRRFNNTPKTIPGNPNTQFGPFFRPVVPRQGSLGRNALRGFPVWQFDLALRRQFKLTERINLQFRSEFFNIFNHPNFADPVSNLQNTANFGVSTSMFGRSLGTTGLNGGFNPLYQIGGPRSIQLSLRLGF